MASTLNLSNAAASAAANNVGMKVFITGGYIVIFTGTQPANADTANGNTEISDHLAFGTITELNGALTIPVTSGNCISSNNATHFRAYTSGGNPAFDGSVGTTDSDINFAGGIGFLSGGQIEITSLTLTLPPH